VRLILTQNEELEIERSRVFYVFLCVE